MKYVAISAELFVENRRRLVERLRPNSLVAVHSNDIMPTNADGSMGFHQSADLFHLSGINQEESILLLAPNAFDEKLREVLFVREASEELTIWEGHKLTKQQAAEISGIKTVKWLGEFRSVFRMLMCEAEQVYLNSNEHARAQVEVETRDARFIRDCQRQFPLHQYHRLAPLMHELRAVKSPHEVDLIRQACGITRDGFARVAKFVKPGVNEAEVEAEFAHEFIRNKATFAYSPIIATGVNNCILHYNQNDQVCEDGQLLLLDVAAGYGQYMSDLTRTIPVSGRFTQRQREVYDAVLRIFRRVTADMRPGITTKQLRKNTELYTTDECLKLGLITQADIDKQTDDNLAVKPFFMHGVAHPIGLDVHDVGLFWKPIQPGWVMTCEPAIYIKNEGFGIRLENDLLITDGAPIDLMADIPIEAEDIERLMRS